MRIPSHGEIREIDESLATALLGYSAAGRMSPERLRDFNIDEIWGV
jgi:hypothetical protein